MLINLRAKNCYSFDQEIEFSLKADMRYKRFSSNVFQKNNFNILKVAGIYGQNNAGKTCLIKCIREMRNILLNERTTIQSNFYTNNHVCELGVTFFVEGREFDFDCKYDTETDEFIYERFAEIQKDQYGNESENVWLLKDSINHEFKCIDNDAEQMMSLIAKNSLLCYMFDVSKFTYLAEMKRLIRLFAEKIDVIDMNNIPIKKTIELLKNENNLQKKVVSFIKNADLYMDDFKYVKADAIEMKIVKEKTKPEEKVLDIPEQLMDQIRLTSVYRGKPVPSILFDSTGTKKIAALASYIIEGLEEGRIIVIDEMDSSIHFKLTRAIVALFNNELNIDAQLIFTVHDINLMDCKRLFRKEQIWFVHKDKEGVYVYSLADFTAQQGVRESTDIMEKYRKGALGALPEPELINSLLDVRGRNEVVNDDEE